MNIEQALSILRQACAAHRVTLKEHQLMQEALAAVERELRRPAGLVPAEPEKK